LKAVIQVLPKVWPHARVNVFIFLDSETPSGSIDTALDHSHLADAV
jgi:hypothetical protein